jgi:hypothetical protein
MTHHESAKTNFQVLSSEVKHLLAAWTMWRRLFYREDEPSAQAQVAAGDRSYRVTGAAAESFFYFTRWHLLRGVVMDLCRLGDRLNTGGQDNLTLARVLAEAPFSHGPDKKSAEHELEWLDECIKTLRPLRHKLIAHFDLDVATGRAPVPSASIDDIDLAVRLTTRIVQRMHATWDGLHLGVQDAPPERWVDERAQWTADVDRLVEVLDRGLDAGAGDSAAQSPSATLSSAGSTS